MTLQQLGAHQRHVGHHDHGCSQGDSIAQAAFIAELFRIAA